MSIYKDIIQGAYSTNGPLNKTKTCQEQWAAEHLDIKDDYARSFVKFQCREFMSFEGKHAMFHILNSLSLFICFFLTLYFMLRGLLVAAIPNKPPKVVGAVVLRPTSFNDISDIIPKHALEKYESWDYVIPKRYTKGYINVISFAIFIRAILKHPLCGYYHLLILLLLADYTRIIGYYSPKAIFTFADEKNFAKPLATLLCEKNRIEHNGFMHGECFYQIDKGFNRYSTYFTWDPFYTELFREMKCEGAMEEYRPLRMSSKAYPQLDVYPVYMTYYESTNNEQSIKKFGMIIRDFLSQGKKVLYRPHPRFMKMGVIKKYIPEECIQNPKDMIIDESVAQSEYVASICSTVLYESLCGGKKIVVDDVCDAEQFMSIASKNYIVLSKPHILLSTLITIKQ